MLGIAQDIVRKVTGLDYEILTSQYPVSRHYLTHTDVDFMHVPKVFSFNILINTISILMLQKTGCLIV